MGTYKSNTRTVLNTTITNVTSYSSGPLDVGDLFELALDCTVTAHLGGHSIHFDVSRIGADGNVYFLTNTGGTSTTGALSASSSASVGMPFGDQIQIDLNNPNGDTITSTVSVKGKG